MVRAALESSGLDHGPLSVHDKMVSLKWQSPVRGLAGADLHGKACGPARAVEDHWPRTAGLSTRRRTRAGN
jgi:hypothetical protein